MPIAYRRKDALKFTEAEERIGRAIREGFIPLGQALVSWVKDQSPEDLGKFKKSVRSRVSGRAFKTRLLVFAGAKHAEFIEKGREPGKAPPPQVLLAWVKRKGIGRDLGKGKQRLRAQKGIAYVIGQRIAKEGLPRDTGFPPSHKLLIFARLRQENEALINATLGRIRARVFNLLNNP